MLRVSDVLARSTRDVVLTDATSSVAAVARQMDRHGVGAIVVTEGELPVGMFTDRDALRRVIACGRDPTQVSVGEVMSQPLRFVCLDDTVGQCRVLMKQYRIRRLPVLSRGKLVALLSARDVQSVELQNQAQTIHDLEEYMHGYYR